MRNTIKDLTIITALVLAATFCFWQGLAPSESPSPTSVTTTSASYVPAAKQQIVSQAIETIRVGQRVWIGDNPSMERDERIGADITNPQQWRKMVLRCPKRDGSTAKVEMLRPLSWLIERNVHSGGQVDIDVPECGIEGLADVLDVQPCPSISAGSGRVVTATFHHQAATIIDVAIEGLEEPIGTTPNHPFWSETKHEFVRADQLRRGEEVRTTDSTALVTSITTRGSPEPVYNLEVQFEHVYRVGDSGVLVHNGGLDILNPCSIPNQHANGRGLGAKAPDQVTAGIKQLEGQYVDDVGQVQPWRAEYDDYGRQIERTDFTDLPAHSHSNPHHHIREYGPGFGPKGKENIYDGPGPTTGS